MKPPAQPSKSRTGQTSKDDASGSSPAKKSRAHSLNTVTLELNAAADLRLFDDGKAGTVFAIHNRFRGSEREPQAIPISVRFGANTIGYAKAAVRKGTHFTVTGELDYNKGETKEFYSIDAGQLRVHTAKDAGDSN